jgi:predicted XRE-type DNA-binding protein
MKRTSAKNAKAEIVRRTGNVFAQLGLPEADDLLRRARVMSLINDAIEAQGLTQEAAAAKTGLGQADVSRIVNGSVTRFSLDRLLTVVDRLGIPIALEQRLDRQGNLVVEVRKLTAPARAPRAAAG